MSRRLVLVLGLFAFAPGCQRINLDKTVTLVAGGVQAPLIVSGPRSQQKILVGITSADPVDVDVVLESNRAGLDELLLAGKRPATGKVVASKEKVKSDTLSATIPAGQEYAIVLSGAKKTTEVKVTVKSE